MNIDLFFAIDILAKLATISSFALALLIYLSKHK